MSVTLRALSAPDTATAGATTRRILRAAETCHAAIRTQFVELYPLRRELLLTPENECGVKKFICTTLRPTQMPYKELYDVRITLPCSRPRLAGSVLGELPAGVSRSLLGTD